MPVYLSNSCQTLFSIVIVGDCLSRLLWSWGDGDGNRGSSNAIELTVFTEIQPFLLNKCNLDCYRTLANFKSSDVVGSDNFCQCSHCFLKERLSRYP